MLDMVGSEEVMANGHNDRDLDISGVVSELGKVRSSLGSNEEEFGFLANLLQSAQLQSLIQAHSTIMASMTENMCQPVLSTAEDIAFEVMGEIQLKGLTQPDAVELFRLLQAPHMLHLLSAHDVVAQKDFVPRLPDPPTDAADEEEETVKIVQLVKSNEPLDGSKGCEPIVGATIKADEQTGAIVIARVMHGGAADRSGLIHVGDEVLEVNDIDVTDRSPNDVLRILTQAQGTITFKLIPADTRHAARESKVRMRALFDYVSSEDKHIPCREAGLDFQRGDILHIVSQDDIYWWQARREGDYSMRAGLIPSRALQERRILAERTQRADDKGISCVARSPGSRSNKIRKIMYDAAENDDFDREEVATYEEVAKLYPRPGYHRPVVLVGPPGVGRNELKRRLVATNPDKYRSVIPYTSRPQRPGESNGVDYHFVSRADMEDGLARGRFVEFGEYRGNLYGTAQESILSIINSGQVCVLCPHYQAIKMVRTSEMKPHMVFVKPPMYERLKETRASSYARSTFDQTSTRGFTDDELRDMLHSAARLEFHYGHLFDETIVNDNLSTAVEQLLRTARRVENEPLWVPASWVQ
ncbi:MAGUK p55 subfamily member 7-like isoform X1 [Pollicipes pollicipes]|uniref:MAGUK p55 subfamily member 7-like isoform X1 n=1 Tax=Pollicipes pollicipes TaxID=41117 RepID=UPI00188552FC|nr:MAGUK p55 subfamily member 7-like isoform X1 [Pollicipes pollicipes]